MRASLLAAPLIVLLASTGVTDEATGRVTSRTGEFLAGWVVAGNQKKITADTKRLKIIISTGVCSTATDPDGLIRKVAVGRRSRSITITVVSELDNVPYPAMCFGVGAEVRRTVRLKGRLGQRSVKDGSTSPPRVVVARPSRRLPNARHHRYTATRS